MISAVSRWKVEKLTHGTEEGKYHSHSYYDIPVFDDSSRLLAGYGVGFSGRRPVPADVVQVGIIDLGGPRVWEPIGTSRAWSWQQGPMVQWIPRSRKLVWNDREGERFLARVYDLESGERRTLPRPIYAIDPEGSFGLTVDFSRLDALRPGYGYPVEGSGVVREGRPRRDGVWRIDLSTGEEELILSLRRAVDFLMTELPLRRRVRHRLSSYRYWFNHVKIAPDGRRFTVKLRYRGRRGGWSDAKGVSLTCGVDGSACRLLTGATSHVIWHNPEELYLWQRDGVYVYRDGPNGGVRCGQLAPRILTHNVHLRHLPDDPERYIYDTPYRREVDLFEYDARSGCTARIASFPNHIPVRGQFRCDLHPCPSPNGRRIAVTSLADGGRQIYLVERS